MSVKIAGDEEEKRLFGKAFEAKIRGERERKGIGRRRERVKRATKVGLAIT